MAVIITRQKAIDRLSSPDNLAQKMGRDRIISGEEKKEGDENVTIVDPETVGIVHKGTSGNHDSARNGSGGRIAIPEEVRVIAGALMPGDSARDAAAAHGLSFKSVSVAAKGCPTIGTHSEEFEEKVLEARENMQKPLRDKALTVLSRALDEITPDKIKALKARESAAVAKDMAVVFEKLNDKAASGASVSFNFYAPRQKKESDYASEEV